MKHKELGYLLIELGEDLGEASHVGACGMVLRKAPVSSWCFRSGTCRKSQERSVGCYCRCRHSRGS